MPQPAFPPRRRLAAPLCLLLALGTAGCGNSGPALVPVAGRVAVGDRPVPSGSLQLRADVSRGNRSMEVPCGLIGPDGRFELATGDRKGAPLGWWKVVVIADNFRATDPPPSPVWPQFPEGYEPPKPLVPERYLSAGTSDVSVEVTANPAEDAYLIRLNP